MALVPLRRTVLTEQYRQYKKLQYCTIVVVRVLHRLQEVQCKSKKRTPTTVLYLEGVEHTVLFLITLIFDAQKCAYLFNTHATVSLVSAKKKRHHQHLTFSIDYCWCYAHICTRFYAVPPRTKLGFGNDFFNSSYCTTFL